MFQTWGSLLYQVQHAQLVNNSLLTKRLLQSWTLSSRKSFSEAMETTEEIIGVGKNKKGNTE